MMTSTEEDVTKNLMPDITNELWSMEFDGSSSSSGSGAGIVLLSPKGEKFPKAYKLAFETTNNTAEYEALLLGLEYAKEKGIKQLKVSRDAELVFNQMWRQYQSKNAKLKAYRNRMWDEIEYFNAFSLSSIPCE